MLWYFWDVRIRTSTRVTIQAPFKHVHIFRRPVLPPKFQNMEYSTIITADYSKSECFRVQWDILQSKSNTVAPVKSITV